MKRLKPVFKLGFLILLISRLKYLGVDGEAREATLDFCEGNSYFHVKRSECPLGLEFGAAYPPPCFCIKGIFRAFMDNCEILDGFARDVCMLPYELSPDPNNTETPRISRLHSLQLLDEPDWDKSHLILETTESEGNWTVLTFDAEETIKDIEMKADYFYTINGVSWISLWSDTVKEQTLCIEPVPNLLAGTQTCKVTRKLNANSWKTRELKVKMRGLDGCAAEIGADKVLLQKEPCIRPLLPVHDECRLTCPREDEKNPDAPNCTDEYKDIFWRNKYLERTLQEYTLMNHLGELPMSPVLNHRSLELIQAMTTITSGFCPDAYIPTDWVFHLSDLFIKLFQDERMKNVEFLTDRNFKAIKNILEQCIEGNYKVRLTSQVDGTGGTPPNPTCPAGGIATGYCKEKDEDCQDPIFIAPIPEKMGIRLRSKHYVPELAWNLMDAVQGICFREFNASYGMLHLLHQATEKLFTPDIRNLWYFPPSKDSGRAENLLLGTGSHEYIQNLEICIGSAYHILNSEAVSNYGPRVSFLERLRRLPLKKRWRKRRSIRSKGSKSKANNPDAETDSLGTYTQIYCRFSEPSHCPRDPGVENKTCNFPEDCEQCPNNITAKCENGTCSCKLCKGEGICVEDTDCCACEENLQPTCRNSDCDCKIPTGNGPCNEMDDCANCALGIPACFGEPPLCECHETIEIGKPCNYSHNCIPCKPGCPAVCEGDPKVCNCEACHTGIECGDVGSCPACPTSYANGRRLCWERCDIVPIVGVGVKVCSHQFKVITSSHVDVVYSTDENVGACTGDGDCRDTSCHFPDRNSEWFGICHPTPTSPAGMRDHCNCASWTTDRKKCSPHGYGGGEKCRAKTKSIPCDDNCSPYCDPKYACTCICPIQR